MHLKPMTHWFSKFSQYLIAVIDGTAPRATLSRARLSEWTRSKHVHLNHTHTPWRITNSTQRVSYNSQGSTWATSSHLVVAEIVAHHHGVNGGENLFIIEEVDALNAACTVADVTIQLQTTVTRLYLNDNYTSPTPSAFHSRLKTHLSQITFLHCLMIPSGLPSRIFNLYWTMWTLAFVCFSFVCQIKLITLSFWVHVKLFCRIVSYLILCWRMKLLVFVQKLFNMLTCTLRLVCLYGLCSHDL